MALVVGRATTLDELQAVQRLRYEVYVTELGRYDAIADHERRLFAEPEDDTSWVFYARDGAEVIASSRLTWGGDGFSDRQIQQYELEPFLDELPNELLAVGERVSVAPAHRGTNVLQSLFEVGEPIVEDHGVRVVFGCCEPHLLSLYIGMGQRTYANHNINSPQAGYLIPLMGFRPDSEALRGLGRGTEPGGLPGCIARALASSGSVHSQALVAPDQYWQEIRAALDELHARGIAAFDSFTDDEAARCIARSNIIECSAGDRVLKQGGSAHNIFVVLSGTLEVRDQGRLLGVLTPGDVFGEMAFLLRRPRTFDVDAVTDDVRVLSLSDGELRKMTTDDPIVAAKLLMNVSRMLCLRLIKSESSQPR